MPYLCSPSSTVQGGWSLSCHKRPKNKIQTTRAFKHQPTKAGDRHQSAGPLVKPPFPRPTEPRSGCPGAGHSAPTGHCEVAAALCATRRERAQLAGPGWLHLPARGRGSAARRVALRPEGAQRWAQRREETPGARGRAEPQGPGWAGARCPRASVRPGSCPAVRSRSVRLSAPRAAGRCRTPRRARPAHLQPPAPGKRDWDAATWVSLVGLLAAWRAAAVLGTARGSKKPAPLPLSSSWPPPPSPIPKRSPRSLAAWEASGQRGRAGEAAPGGRKEGVSSLGMGKARRGSGRE